MKARVLSIGDELIRGETVNSNCAFISRELSAIGIETDKQESIGDDPRSISAALKDAASCPVVIISGGLGPTDDDITRKAFADSFGLALVKDLESEEAVVRFFKKRGKTPSEKNLSMAYLPHGATAIRNDWGTACGFVLERGNALYYTLPGVPYELENMFKGSVKKDLMRRFPGLETKENRIFKMYGIPESRLNEELEKIERPEGVRIGFYPRFPEVHLELFFTKNGEDSFSGARKYLVEIKRRFAQYIFSTNSSTIEEKLVDALIKNKLTLAVAESCTGGLITATLVNVAGSSRCLEVGAVTYSDASKRKILGIDEGIVRKKGAVSAECALKMAQAVRRRGKTDIGVSVTGIAGPGGGTKQKPVGTTYIAYSTAKNSGVEHFVFQRDRNMNRKLAMYEVFFGLFRIIKENK